MKISIYHVKGCKIRYDKIFTGYVINIDDESIIDSIKRKVGVDSLLCTKTNEGFDYDKVDLFSVPLSELSVGDLLFLLNNNFRIIL